MKKLTRNILFALLDLVDTVNQIRGRNLLIIFFVWFGVWMVTGIVRLSQSPYAVALALYAHSALLAVSLIILGFVFGMGTTTVGRYRSEGMAKLLFSLWLAFGVAVTYVMPEFINPMGATPMLEEMWGNVFRLWWAVVIAMLCGAAGELTSRYRCKLVEP